MCYIDIKRSWKNYSRYVTRLDLIEESNINYDYDKCG